jgi:transcriptional regulator with XRE-family HTH domain
MSDYYIEIGEQLKARRLEQKREIKDIAEETRVSAEYLEAIEAGDIDSFPSTVYYNLFARSYARELGFDPDRLFVVSTEDSLELERVEALGPDVTEEELKALEPKENNSMTKVILWLVGVVLVIFIAVMIFTLTAGEKEKNAEEMSGHGDTAVVEQASEDTSMADVPITHDSDDSLLSKPVYGESLPPKMRLRIDANQLSWVFVMSDGDTALNRTIDSGDYRIIRAQRQFIISSGNPTGVTFRLNDTLLKPLSVGGGLIRNVEINRMNKDDYFYIPDESVNEDTAIGQF